MINFSLHVAQRPKVTIPPVASITGIGVYDEQTREIVQPDRSAVRAALPYRWRRAFDRSPSFWYDKDARVTLAGKASQAPFCVLRGYRGAALATVYAIPFRVAG